MAEKIEIIDGELKLTKTDDEIITTMTKEEVVDKIAETQTKVDHLNIDLIEAKTEKAKWDVRLAAIEETK